MRRWLNHTLLLGSLATFAVGCGTTQIIASDPQASITVDGVPVGRGMASVQKTGLPGSVQVTAKTEDGRSTRQTMSRSFGWTAGLLGFVTYGVCFIACWQYPDVLMVNLPAPARVDSGSGWDAPGTPSQNSDPWLLPPPGWQPATKPAAPVSGKAPR
jgi:hypothetical protein